ncbi:hypothetical protein [Nocardia sp. NBC_01327]|uniref:hypothetical protein n=1 Tax=Nocardia sp. NBC_01327 TaxID=2903593 RepID=UPI002E14B29E|nr:hypothetical protein OG326_34550 [Nocardia sp. NBC_01327]
MTEISAQDSSGYSGDGPVPIPPDIDLDDLISPDITGGPGSRDVEDNSASLSLDDLASTDDE